MSELRLRYDWVDYASRDHAWIMPTFAQLSIDIDDQNVTRVLDKRSRTTRDKIVTPLYPLVEWILANWWTLFYEAAVPSRGILVKDYLSRHSFREAREGYAYPDLRIYPEGEWTKVEWYPQISAHQRVEFLNGGMARVSTSELKQLLVDLVDAVLARLDQFGIVDSWAHQEWRAINDVDPDEKAFCRSVAYLGLDPFELDAGTSGTVIAAIGGIPVPVRDELLQAVTAATLVDSAAWLSAGLQAIGSTPTTTSKWSWVRDRVGAVSSSSFPWELGYQLAQTARTSLNLNDATPAEITELLHEVSPIVQASKPPIGTLDAVAGFGNGAPVCYTAKRRSDAQRFASARGLSEFLLGNEGPLLLSSAETGRQQRGRAFAAEFLAPAAHIASHLSGDEIGKEEVEELAAEFQVSSMVIEYQLTNHQLARIANE